MKIPVTYFVRACLVIIFISVMFSFVVPERPVRFPYEGAGLTERQAAAHLLYRFTFGPTPGQIETVVKRGLENWFQDQLNARLPEDTLNRRLGPYSVLGLSAAEIAVKFPRKGVLVKMAAKDGAIEEDSARSESVEVKKQLHDYMEKNGLRLDRDLVKQMTYQKIIRAVYANNQMQEVMTDFWFNHFNVSFTKTACSIYIPDYERVVIRPNALGNFETLLIATAKSPAMLFYLDNIRSTGPLPRKALKNNNESRKGLNENYAREVMELHTLGVDGGYTQGDVTEAARVLTGWGIFPQKSDNAIRKMFDRLGESKMADKGFVHEGDFLFIPGRHETGEKEVLGKKFSGGYQEGMQLLRTLAHHPSTARFISRKIAVRFVNDDPPAALIDKMAKVFSESNGDIKKVLIAMVSSPEFWGQTALREKIKSPFELTVSALRSMHASVSQPQFLVNWISQMGQKLYTYPAPTGFPDRGTYWISTGALLTRMNFGLALAADRIKGVSVDLIALNDNHEPESAEAALLVYTKRVLPERPTETTVQRLTPLLNEQNLQTKLRKVAAGDSIAAEMPDKAGENEEPMADSQMVRPVAPEMGTRQPEANQPRLSQIVGIIIGSPEFQRR